MIKNTTLVQIFLSHFYRQRVEQLAAFISPDFKYSSPATQSLNFAEFSSHCNDLFDNVSIRLNQIFTENDRHFQVAYDINIRHKSFDTDCYLPSHAQVSLKNNLIDEIVVRYDPKYINGITRKPKTVFL